MNATVDKLVFALFADSISSLPPKIDLALASDEAVTIDDMLTITKPDKANPTNRTFLVAWFDLSQVGC
jgi:hypothetical protein